MRGRNTGMIQIGHESRRHSRTSSIVGKRRRSHRSTLATKVKGVGWIHLYYVHILTRHRNAKNILVGCKSESEIGLSILYTKLARYLFPKMVHVVI